MSLDQYLTLVLTVAADEARSAGASEGEVVAALHACMMVRVAGFVEMDPDAASAAIDLGQAYAEMVYAPADGEAN